MLDRPCERSNSAGESRKAHKTAHDERLQTAMQNGPEVRSDTLSEPRDAELPCTETLGSQEFEPAASHSLQVSWAAGAEQDRGFKVYRGTSLIRNFQDPTPNCSQTRASAE